jgi:rfaE bifunctional protein nucleotidyltransferase chain/domain
MAREAEMPDEKILSLEAVAERVDALRRDGRTIVHCHGCFDLMHVGHIKHLQAARRLGDLLIVTVTADEHVNKGPGRPVFPARLRAESLAALDCVAFVAIVAEPTAAAAIRLLRPDHYVKGQEFEDLPHPPPRLQAEIDAAHEAGTKVSFTHEAVFSSTALLRTLGSRDEEAGRVDPPAEALAGGRPPAPSDEARRFLEALRARHTVDGVLAGLASLRPLRALVIGEAIVDEYAYCLPLGKSPKEAIVTTREVRRERHAGGVLACANHLAGFCDEVHVVAGLGREDSHEQFIRDHLRPNVTPRFVVRPDAPTVTKRRYVWEPFLVKMFEVVTLNEAPLPPALEGELLEYLDGVLPRYDLVIVTDYGHGFLSQRAAAVLAERAPFLAVSVQANAANLGFNLVTKYPRAAYACIDEPELRLATGDRWRPVGELAEALRDRFAAISVTRGGLGALACGAGGAQWEVPAFASEVVDRLGAGDAYLAVTAPGVAVGMPMDVVGFLGCLAGALAVRIVGNRSSIDRAAVEELAVEMLR